MEEHEYFELSEQQLSDIRTWATVQLKVVRFQNESSLITFEKLFGVEEGKRLFKHFAVDCKHNYTLFKTYLTVQQGNIVLKHIINLS